MLKPVLGSQLNLGSHLARGLVGCWLFNEGSGNKVFDLSGNGNTGIFASNTAWGSGKFGSTVVFSGSGDIISLVNSKTFNLTTGASFIFSINRPTDTTRAIIGNSGEAGFKRIIFIAGSPPTLKLFTDTDGDQAAASVTAADGNSHLYAITAINKAIQIYEDGQPVTMSDSVVTDTAVTFNQIGAAGTTSFEFIGPMDYLVVYARYLFASEVALLCRAMFQI